MTDRERLSPHRGYRQCLRLFIVMATVRSYVADVLDLYDFSEELFSDEIIDDRVAGAQPENPKLREWHTKHLARLPGLKFMRTLWVAAVAFA